MLTVADAQENRTAVAGDHDAVGLALVDDGDPVGTLDEEERGADGIFELRLRLSGDQVGEHLGVCLGGEYHVGEDCGPQLRGVLDDPVVNYGDDMGSVDVRVGIGVGGRTMGRPPGVADADVPAQAFGCRPYQLVDSSGTLVDLQTAPLTTATPAES